MSERFIPRKLEGPAAAFAALVLAVGANACGGGKEASQSAVKPQPNPEPTRATENLGSGLPTTRTPIVDADPSATPRVGQLGGGTIPEASPTPANNNSGSGAKIETGDSRPAEGAGTDVKVFGNGQESDYGTAVGIGATPTSEPTPLPLEEARKKVKEVLETEAKPTSIDEVRGMLHAAFANRQNFEIQSQGLTFSEEKLSRAIDNCAGSRTRETSCAGVVRISLEGYLQSGFVEFLDLGSATLNYARTQLTGQAEENFKYALQTTLKLNGLIPGN